MSFQLQGCGGLIYRLSGFRGCFLAAWPRAYQLDFPRFLGYATENSSLRFQLLFTIFDVRRKKNVVLLN